MSLESCHIRKATIADLDALVDLHYRVFDEHSHYAMLFGRRFIRATYRWYCRAPMAFALVGEIDGEIKGSCTVNRGSYYAVFRANPVEFALLFLRKPRLLLVKPVRHRLATLLKGYGAPRQTMEPHASRAYLAYLAVDASARGSGMGNNLIKRAIEECERRGWGGIVTAIHRSNVPARFMYKTLGFEDAPDLSHDDLVGVAFNRRLAEARQAQER